MFHEEVGAAGKVRADAFDRHNGRGSVFKSEQGLFCVFRGASTDQIGAAADDAPDVAPDDNGFVYAVATARQIDGCRARINGFLDRVPGKVVAVGRDAEFGRPRPLRRARPRAGSGVSRMGRRSPVPGVPNRLEAGLVAYCSSVTVGPVTESAYVRVPLLRRTR